MPGGTTRSLGATAAAETLVPADNKRWVRRADALWRWTFDGVIVLPVGEAQPVSLSGTGAALWELLDKPIAGGQVVDRLARVHEVAPDVVADDVHRFLAELERRNMVERVQ